MFFSVLSLLRFSGSLNIYIAGDGDDVMLGSQWLFNRLCRVVVYYAVRLRYLSPCRRRVDVYRCFIVGKASPSNIV